ncbi:hypothetical protein QYM36_005427 [Artemia franciscana]|uniref:Uncharacterized protein n=1 Tax=Artemia franciscana TaxID=6661 RepID=A0AA88LBC4_ARTSF|nr:hypothetical protein QYM36_005427 [Artemia franciscana]
MYFGYGINPASLPIELPRGSSFRLPYDDLSSANKEITSKDLQLATMQAPPPSLIGPNGFVFVTPMPKPAKKKGVQHFFPKDNGLAEGFWAIFSLFTATVSLFMTAVLRS